MVNASIDYFRRNEIHYNNLNISYAQYQTFTESAIDSLSAQEIVDVV
jgi:hypothetical protein